ncbi:chromate transporter [Amycolatopsis sp. DSM 110486]|uniref:chromate transporter n=1 Tax=Amycolatopsis sp. DSM 110486 TaxID=2865832 RepID=UPI001C6A51A4|nr:chromate transporter [Amycolatopsis sp. DSM 110486]QYN20543.1 chromate transporter [Amycolatopsis sp. DSM 110486]
MTATGRARRRSSDRRWPAVFFAFARIGATSFGGGSATIAAMRRTSLRRGWLTEDEFLDTVVLSRLTPGITILAQVLLIGRAVAGLAGMAAAMLGLMAPSITITIALAWCYTRVADLPGAAGPLAAVAAVAAGFAIALALQLVRDVLRRGRLLRGFLCYGAFLVLALLIDNPLVLMGIAVLAALVAPQVFTTGHSGPDGDGEGAHGDAD